MVHRRLAALARAQQSDEEEALKAVHSLLHACASRPEGPAAPVVRKAVERIRLASNLSKTTG